MRSHLIAAFALAALTACQEQEAATEPSEAASAEPPTAATAPSEAAPALATTARSETIENDLISFSYKYPASAGAIPALKAQFDADLDSLLGELQADASEARKAAKEGGYPYNAYGYWTEWKTVTDLPGWLSLSAEISTYMGGAHPNHGFDSLVWDKQAGKRLDPVTLFTNTAALSRAIRAPFCRALDAQRREKRGGDGKLGGIDEFDQCIDPIESGTLILGSSNGKAFDRIGILVPPYNAGPYAEGSYEVTVPVTQTVLAAVKRPYRSTFVVAR